MDHINIDSEKKLVMLNGKPMESITEIRFYWKGGERPKIVIKEDADTTISGILVNDKIKTLKCSCGYYVGEFIGECSEVQCPSCGKHFNS